MKKLKMNKGITLIALILTIIVLIILAVVAINVVTGDGIIAHAKNARDTYERKSQEENELLKKYEEQIKESMNNGGKADGATVKGSLNVVISEKENAPLTDEYGNKITVPAGFKILVDSTTDYNADNINVTKGIVVEDEKGNQFVWIPVGTIYTNKEKTASKTITLGRYSSFSKTNGTYTVAQKADDYVEKVEIDGYTEDTTERHDSSYGNTIANNIGDFCTKSLTSGGYYIGRYEARYEEPYDRNSGMMEVEPSTITLKASDKVCSFILQAPAANACKNMYTNNPFTSDLVNSYAWDTAIIFFQEFGGDLNSDYANKTSVNDTPSFSELTTDKVCNVYDMASNCWEWTTETSNNSGYACCMRGGASKSTDTAISRNLGSTVVSGSSTALYNRYSFRPVLYM